MAKGILIAAMDFSAGREDEFHDWYDLEHVPERLRVPGFLNAERWIDTKNPKVAVATYDLETVGVLYSTPYVAIAGANSSSWTKRTAKFRKGLMRYEGEQLFPGDKVAPKDAVALLIAMNVAPEHEAEFNEWYNTEHIPALGGVKGTLSARRYRGTGATQRYTARSTISPRRKCRIQASGRRQRTPRGPSACGRTFGTIFASNAGATRGPVRSVGGQEGFLG
jgi:hypothetical protein